MRPAVPEDHDDRTAASDPRLNVALEASAGTGKTRVLVERYIRLVQEGADPRHILAITFTRKAAGEMKGRIIDTFRSDPSLWSSLRERLFDIHVATIDAFCFGLLKEFPLEAGLDPDLDLLDEVDVEQLTEEALDHALGPSSTGLGLTFLTSVFGESALRRALRDFLRSRLVKKDTIAHYVHRFVPQDLRLEQALEDATSRLSDFLGGPRGRHCHHPEKPIRQLGDRSGEDSAPLPAGRERIRGDELRRARSVQFRLRRGRTFALVGLPKPQPSNCVHS